MILCENSIFFGQVLAITKKIVRWAKIMMICSCYYFVSPPIWDLKKPPYWFFWCLFYTIKLSSPVLLAVQLPITNRACVRELIYSQKSQQLSQSGLSDVPSSENAWINNFFSLQKIYIYKKTTHKTNKFLLSVEWIPDFIKLYSSAQKITHRVQSDGCKFTPLL